jgi:hypothetical protein
MLLVRNMERSCTRLVRRGLLQGRGFVPEAVEPVSRHHHTGVVPNSLLVE